MTPSAGPSVWTMTAPVADHLWHSTLVLAMVFLLTLAFRRNRAAVRYRLWLVASVKFLMPVGVLIEIGRRLGWPAAPVLIPRNLAVAMDTIGQPAAAAVAAAAATTATAPPAPPPSGALAAMPAVLLAIWFAGTSLLIIAWWLRWRRVAASLTHAEGLTDERVLTALRRLQPGARPMALVSTSSIIEPGIFGIVRPVLLWPRHVTRHLTDAQIDAIVVHELSHVRRRDNLTAVIHMLAEAVFWFYPPIWWIGARLMDERERACDEEVVRLGADPHEYATGILNVCRHAVESPLICAAAVSGGNLSQRIERIITNAAIQPLTRSRKALLLITAGLAAAVPIVAGALRPIHVHAQPSLVTDYADVPRHIAITRNVSGGPMIMQAIVEKPWGAWLRGKPTHGRFTARNMTARELIRLANNLAPYQIIGPAWIKTDFFDITVTGPENPFTRHSRILRQLLEDRFQLQAHRETRVVDRPASFFGLGSNGPVEVLVIDHIDHPITDLP